MYVMKEETACFCIDVLLKLRTFESDKDVHFTRQISAVAEIRIKATRHLLVISCDKVFRAEEQAARHVFSLHWTSLMIISAENFIVIWRSPEAEFKLTESLRLFFFWFLFLKRSLLCVTLCKTGSDVLGESLWNLGSLKFIDKMGLQRVYSITN